MFKPLFGNFDVSSIAYSDSHDTDITKTIIKEYEGEKRIFTPFEIARSNAKRYLKMNFTKANQKDQTSMENFNNCPERVKRALMFLMIEKMSKRDYSLRENPSLPKEDYNYFKKLINKSTPTEKIYLGDIEKITDLDNLWKKDNELLETPAELLISNTIPVKDIIFTYDHYDWGDAIPKPEFNFQYYMEMTNRVVIFDEPQAVSYDPKQKEISIRGALICNYRFKLKDKRKASNELKNIIKKFNKKEEHRDDKFILFGTNKDFDCILLDGTGISDLKYLLKQYNFIESLFFEYDEVYEKLNTWYGIQICLLHPKMRYIINEEKNNTDNTIYKYKNNISHKTYNIKTINLNIHKLISSIHDIKCPLWRVRGHYRTYSKDDRKVWIEGYWKGQERNNEILKQHYETRERILR